jgi:Family of unknown function (DUF5681)
MRVFEMGDSEGLEVESDPIEIKSTEGGPNSLGFQPSNLGDEPEMVYSPMGTKPRGRPFAPGKSGNPNGRPKGARNKTTLAAEVLLEGEAETLVRKLIDKAKGGDISALRFCLERICPARRDRLVTVVMPEIGSVQDASKAAAAVLAACAAGEISTGEAADLMGLVASYVRLLEIGDIEARLRAVETASGVSS